MKKNRDIPKETIEGISRSGQHLSNILALQEILIMMPKQKKKFGCAKNIESLLSLYIQRI